MFNKPRNAEDPLQWSFNETTTICKGYCSLSTSSFSAFLFFVGFVWTTCFSRVCSRSAMKQGSKKTLQHQWRQMVVFRNNLSSLLLRVFLPPFLYWVLLCYYSVVGKLFIGSKGLCVFCFAICRGERGRKQKREGRQISKWSTQNFWHKKYLELCLFKRVLGTAPLPDFPFVFSRT